MFLKLSIILSLIISQSSGAVSGPRSSSILETIRSEVKNNSSDHICSTPKQILNSEYVKACDKLPFPPANIKLEGNYDSFLCLALFDRALHICHAGARNFEMPILQNRSAFDKLITDEIRNPETVLELCMYFEKIQPVYLEKTKLLVEDLSKSLKEPLKCVKICSKEDNEVNPLCLVIKVIDEKIQKAEMEHKEKEKSQKESKNADKGPKPEGPKLEGPKPEVQTMTGIEVPISIPPVPPVAPDNSRANDKSSANVHAGTAPETDHSGGDKTKKVKKPGEAKAVLTVDTTKPEELSKPVLQPVVNKGISPEKTKTTLEKVDESANQAQLPPVVGANGKEKDGVGKDDKGQSKVASSEQAQVEKSTLSANTGGEEEGQIGQDEGSDEDDGDQMPPPQNSGTAQESNPGSFNQPEDIPRIPSITPDDDSHFFGYFTLFGLFGIGLFAAYHHKHKIFAMLLEGRRSRGGRGRRRPSTANYRKLDCTLEEAVTSQCSSNVTHVIY